MNDILKKPYEISLWDEQLCWHRRKLELVGRLEKDQYSSGTYYYESNTAAGDSKNPFVLDNGPWVEDRIYYSLPAKKEERDENGIIIKNYKEGPNSSDTDLTEEEQLDEAWEASALFQFYKEKKLCVIGSSILTSPIHAV
jgi:hypothetical protein